MYNMKHTALRIRPSDNHASVYADKEILRRAEWLSWAPTCTPPLLQDLPPPKKEGSEGRSIGDMLLLLPTAHTHSMQTPIHVFNP